jgi:hypothetical protein
MKKFIASGLIITFAAGMVPPLLESWGCNSECCSTHKVLPELTQTEAGCSLHSLKCNSKILIPLVSAPHNKIDQITPLVSDRPNGVSLVPLPAQPEAGNVWIVPAEAPRAFAPPLRI